VSYTNESGRRQILDDIAAAADLVAVALAEVGDAYEQLDDQSAERLEGLAFRPLQAAYGQLKRTNSEFAARHRLPAGELRPAAQALPADARVLLVRAGDAAREADEMLAELQDSLLPVEVGDEALRAGLSRTRMLIAPLPGAVDTFIRTLGR
jgi:hypothetical protein